MASAILLLKNMYSSNAMNVGMGEPAVPGGDAVPFGTELLMNPLKRQNAMAASVGADNVSSWDDRIERGSVAMSVRDADEPRTYASPAATQVPFRTAAYSPSAVSKDALSEVPSEHYRDVRQPFGGYAEQTRTADDILNAKRELLYKFNRLEKKGVMLPKKFTLNSSYEEMKLEYERVCKDREVDNSIMLQRRIMLTAISTMEFVNNKFDPFELRLDGWSESVSDKIHEYDEVFEELHDKYRGKGSLPPEVKLMMMVSGSAFMFHITNTMFSKQQRPSAQQIFDDDPELARRFAAATAANMSRNDTSGFSNMFGSLFGGGEHRTEAQAGPSGPSGPAPARMSGPGNLDAIFGNVNDGTESDVSERIDPHITGHESVGGVEIFSDTAESETSDVTKFPDNASILPSKTRRMRSSGPPRTVLNL